MLRLRDPGEPLAIRRGIGAGTAVTGIGTVAAVDHGIPGVGVVVAVELVVPGVPEQLVVAACAGRDATDRIVIADDWRVVAGTATDHVVATGAGDHALAGERAAVADQEPVVAVAAGDGVVAAVARDEACGIVVSPDLNVVVRATDERVVAALAADDDALAVAEEIVPARTALDGIVAAVATD